MSKTGRTSPASGRAGKPIRGSDPKRLVFIDETWAILRQAQDQYGAAARMGVARKRLKAKAPYGHWKTMTFLAALRHDRIDAPWVVDGPINGVS